DSGVGPLLQLADGPELNRSRRTRLRAGRGEPRLQPVVAEGALSGYALLIHADDAERTAGHAVAAAVADVLLDVHRVKLGARDGAGRAHLQTARLHAVLADVRHHQPASAHPVGVVQVELLAGL